MSSVRPVSDRARILYAALALPSFTAKDIADYSGIDIRTVRTQLIRDRRLFSRVGKDVSGRRGGSFNRYQLMAEARQELIEVTREARAYLAVREADTGDSDEDNLKRFEIALNSAQAAIRQISATTDPALRLRRQRRAEDLMAGVDSIAEFVPAAGKATAKIAELRKHFSAVTTVAAAPERLPATREAGQAAHPAGEKEASRVKVWFEEWLRGLPRRGATSVTAIHDAGFDQHIDSCLADVPHATEPQAIFGPAALLLEQMGSATMTIRQRLGERVVDRLLSVSAQRDARAFTALAVMAAVFDCEKALDPLLAATLTSRVGVELDGRKRSIILRALARFARPRGVSVWRSAASYAQALLGRPDRRPDDFPDLVAAAMRADMIDPRALLHRFAQTTYGDPRGVFGRDASREGTVMRNITVVLQELGFNALTEELPELLKHEYGRSFFKALSDPAYGALELLDRDDYDYAIRLGPIVAQRVGIKQPPDVPLPIQSHGEAGDALYQLMEERSVAYDSTASVYRRALMHSLVGQLAEPEAGRSSHEESPEWVPEEMTQGEAGTEVWPRAYERFSERLGKSHAHKDFLALSGSI